MWLGRGRFLRYMGIFEVGDILTYIVFMMYERIGKGVVGVWCISKTICVDCGMGGNGRS